MRSLFVSIILSGVICPAFAQIYTIRTLAGNGVEGYSGDGGPAAGAQLNVVNGVAVDAAGNVYIADTNNCRIRKVSKGVIATVAGNGNCGYSGDNGPATSAALYYPSAVAVDASGNLYIADTANNRIREVAGGVITTVAGNGYGACAPWPSCSGGFTGDNGSATSAELYSPNGVAVDSSGNIFISDTYNNRIREVSNGIITTIVGTGIGAYGGDGGLATNAKLYGPEAVAVDASGALYIADTGNNRVRKVQNGTITNVAGNGTQGYIGDGGNAINAEMYYPEGVAVDSAGNLFISDTGNNRIRKVTKLIISTIAGSGPSGGANGGFGGDNGVATNAQLYAPVCIGVDATGNVYIADSDNFRVRELTPYTPVFSAQAASLGTAIGSGSFQVAIADDIPWTAVSSVGWITITGGASGTGSGVVSFTVQANTGPARTGTITIGGQVFTITQESATATNLSLAGSIAQIASAGGWDTSLTLVNLGSASGEARLNFSGNDGSAPWLPFTFPQQSATATTIGATFDQTLIPHASLIFDTTGPTAQTAATGAAQLLTAGNIGGFAIFTYTPTGQAAVSPVETRNASSYLLAFDNTGGVLTGLAIANLASSAANIPVVIRDDTGKQIGTGTVSLAAGGHNSFMLTDSTYGFPVTAGARGTVEFDTPQNGRISVLGIRANPLPNSSSSNPYAETSLPVLANVGTGGGVLAHLASSGGYQTTFTLVNTGAAAATANLNFYDGNGAALALPLSFPQTGTLSTAGSVSQSIPAGGSLIVLVQDPGGATAITGSAVLTTTGNVGGFAVFRYNPTGQEAVVPLQSVSSPSYILAFDNTGSLTTGMAIANVAAQPATVNVILRNDSGAQIGTGLINLAARGHASFMSTDTSSGGWSVTAGVRGTIEFDTPTGGQIAPIGLRAATIPGGFTMTTIPVMQP